MAAAMAKRYRVEFILISCNPDGSREARTIGREWVWTTSSKNAERLARRRTGFGDRANCRSDGVIEWYDADVLEVASEH